MRTISKTLLIFIAGLLVLASCERGTKDYQAPENNISQSPKIQSIVTADNAFSFELVKKINAVEQGNEDNFFISPLSVAYALGMAYNGADGSTKTQMEDVLHKSGLSLLEINQSYKELMQYLVTNDPAVLLTIANSIWYRDNFLVEQSFLDINSNYFNALINPLNFDDPASKDIINAWVAAQTNNKIQTIINNINPQDVMYIINAIYFKASWKYEFDPASTIQYPFSLADGSVKNVETMMNGEGYYYCKNSLFEAIELPYGKEDFSMLVFVPVNGNTVNDIIDELNPVNWSNWLSSFQFAEQANVFLPKFKYEYEKSLNQILCDLGMPVAFDSFNANFSKINPNAQLYISDVLHKTYVDVNEEGTEAAAVTSISIGTTSVPQNIMFFANKPFLYVIKEKQTDAIIFMGKIMDPVY